MAISNHERVGKALEHLRAGLSPFVERELQAALKEGSVSPQDLRMFIEEPMLGKKSLLEWDVAALLRLMWDQWHEIFRKTLGHAERSLVSELREVRNKWAHQDPFGSDDTDRALDSAERLLTAISAPQADELRRIKEALRRLIYEEQVRSERRKNSGLGIESQTALALPPWRELVTPHRDVASGRYQQAEFAADLWQVKLGEGSDEYRDPQEFFRRSYLTESLQRLLVGALRRLSGQGGDPVLQLQTNFGGGKTHSMLALYHLFGGTPPAELTGVEQLMAEAGLSALPAARRVVLVGNKISPGNPVIKSDGTVVRTLWGELAWQLGGKKAFARIQADDEKATNPGDVLRELMQDYGPCLILIDEWVAYARQLHDHNDLPGGSFETHFTFAQALTESAKLAQNCLLVISLPASDTAGSPHTRADDAEVGGLRGREALDRLRNVVGRVESSWRPASAEEGFEIVRRRLFEPLADPEKFKQRDVVARAFAELYRAQAVEFPPECHDSDYEKRIKAAFPIHPEIFDRLYSDWSTLAKFQRTRGVLRLMAAVIHSLWERGDRNPLILPSMIPLDDSRVQFELTRYLSDNWVPVIAKDVDGVQSLPLRIDGEVPNLGKAHATRRVARTIYLGSAPVTRVAHLGLEERRVKLGCVMPGESPALFADALRRLAAAATYLYQDGPRVWYATQPTVTKIAEDRAEQLSRDPDKTSEELARRLRSELKNSGDFARIHPLPRASSDVPDDPDTRLVVLGPEQAHNKEADSPALAAAKEILEMRGTSPRLYRNSLVFLAVDRVRLQDLDEALRRFLAWESILADKESLNLTTHQAKQAETQRAAADSAVNARLPESYHWLLVPVQGTPQEPLAWQSTRLSGGEALAPRASRKLRNDELLVTSLGGTRLRMELDRVPLWRGNHVPIQLLSEDFARYTYLPRLARPEVLYQAVADGVALLAWQNESFAYAEGFDEASGRYRGLQGGRSIANPEGNNQALLVKAEVAAQQLAVAQQAATTTSPGPDTSSASPGSPGVDAPEDVVATPRTDGNATPWPQPDSSPPLPPSPAKVSPKRFHGSVRLDATRVGRDASVIADEVIAHLTGLVGSEVSVTLEIEAKLPDAVPEHVLRTVTENASTMKFDSHAFEQE
jgi:predicted AAA+ superfamily ATPase